MGFGLDYFFERMPAAAFRSLILFEHDGIKMRWFLYMARQVVIELKYCFSGGMLPQSFLQSFHPDKMC